MEQSTRMSTFATKRTSERVAHNELCANRGDSEFPQDYRGNRAVGLSVDVCYERGSVSPFNKSRLFWLRWRHPLLQLGRPRSAEEGGAFRFRCSRAAPPSATIRHLHDQRVRRQGDTL
jgi:hypothetical protein